MVLVVGRLKHTSSSGQSKENSPSLDLLGLASVPDSLNRLPGDGLPGDEFLTQRLARETMWEGSACFIYLRCYMVVLSKVHTNPNLKKGASAREMVSKYLMCAYG